MNPPQPANQAGTGFRELAERQIGELLAGLSNPSGTAVVNAVAGDLEASLRQMPSPPDEKTEAIWAANAVRIGLEDLADRIDDRYQHMDQSPGKPGRQAQENLHQWRVYHRASGELTGTERQVWLLVQYLSRNPSACGQLLSLSEHDVERSLATAARQVQDTQTIEAALEFPLIDELRRINYQVWPTHCGILGPRMIALVRDAAQMRMWQQGWLPATPNPAVLRSYYLAFGRLYRGPRKGICQGILTSSNLVPTREIIRLLNLTELANREFAWLTNSDRARRALRWRPDAVRGQDHGANWLTLTNDACLSINMVATLIGTTPDVVRPAIIEYQKAINDWIADHPLDTR